MMHISTFLELEQEDMGEVNNNPAVCSMGQTGGYQQAGPQGESRRERRVQRDTSYSQQLPSSNRGMHMNQNPGNTGLQQIVPSPNKGNRVMLGPPPNPGPYGPRLIANPVTSGRASNPVGAIGINWGNQASPQAKPWSPTATATPPIHWCIMNARIWMGGSLTSHQEAIASYRRTMKLLREIEDEARKSRKLRWTDERIAQFEKLKQIFNDLQSLYFLVAGGTVKVYTDASDYAIGGYVCQIVNGREQPVGFMSKTLMTNGNGQLLSGNVMRFT